MSEGIRLFLVRHGNTFEAGAKSVQIGSATDLPLTARGREQAGEMGLFLKRARLTPAAVYAGVLKRQKEAALIIAETAGIPGNVQLDVQALNEIDYGLWEGLTQEELAARYGSEYEEWEKAGRWAKSFGGSLEQTRAAISSWLDALLRRHDDGEIVLAVTSNANMRIFYSLIKEDWEVLSAANRVDQLKVKTGCYCEFDVKQKGLEVIVWNKNPSEGVR